MLNDYAGEGGVMIVTGFTDLRRGIDGLAGIIRHQFQIDPFNGALFLFCGRRKDRIRGLYWEGSGFVVLTKRLEQGIFQWPKSEPEVKTLTPQQFRWLMEGLSIDQPKAHKTMSGINEI